MPAPVADVSRRPIPWWRPRFSDLLWIALFAGMAFTGAEDHPLTMPLLAALGFLQIAEPRLLFAGGGWANAALLLIKLSIAYLLIGYTGGVTSHYYMVLLLPVVSAATNSSVGWALGATGAAAALYLSFLLYVDWSQYDIGIQEERELALRMIFFGMVGYLVNTLGALNREQTRRYRAVAEELAAANRQLLEATEAIRRSDRLAALGQLSAGLAHELRNPLGTIRASAEVLSRRLQDADSISREMAGFIDSEVERANSLVTRFLEFARPVKLRLAPESPVRVLERAIDAFERDPRRGGVRVERNLAPLPEIALDSELLERVFVNLLMNAAEAGGPDADITVQTLQSGEAAEVLVTDRGSGIEPQHLDQIFNPFFTTKKEGVGLGLSIVAKIVDEHGGTIQVASEPGAGSTFRVALPLAERSRVSEADSPAREKSRS